MTDVRPPRNPLVPPGGVDLHERDMTATFAADVPLRAAQQRLAEIGQWLPIDGDPDLPVGTLVEHNSTGPLRLGFGAWRDLLLGVQFTNGRGELISAGGRTVKNVAGYDLTKLMVGQRGVFGRVVSITTRTYRRPAGAVLARLALDPRTLGRLLPTPLRPQWALLTGDGLWCGYLGDEATLEFYQAHLGDASPLEVTARSVEQDIDYRAALWRATGAQAFRASVPPARILDFVGSGGIDQWVADAAFGIVLGSAAPETARRAAEAVGGTLTLPDSSTSSAERRIIERLKQAFDPDNTLTPLPRQTR